ncbi:hypothetical protein IFM89_014058 [Coptis chinensis]|uniref:RNase H type-1 domain-containing protein n=1 Tax=Coptis chinensis TaxID=261450 RepID=A0A835HJS2_9MAGN|nr:hypothetical protein IFM89_014058 [Coptis chinensis]
MCIPKPQALHGKFYTKLFQLMTSLYGNGFTTCSIGTHPHQVRLNIKDLMRASPQLSPLIRELWASAVLSLLVAMWKMRNSQHFHCQVSHVKINCDGCSLGNPGRGGAGLTFRDEHAQLLGILARGLGIVTSYEAEDWQATSELSYYRITHIWREANFSADLAAKHGASLAKEVYVWSDTRPTFVPKLGKPGSVILQANCIDSTVPAEAVCPRTGETVSRPV